jgi:hypothetical protein
MLPPPAAVPRKLSVDLFMRSTAALLGLFVLAAGLAIYIGFFAGALTRLARFGWGLAWGF